MSQEESKNLLRLVHDSASGILRKGGDGGHNGGMSDLEKRVSALEVKLATIDTKVDALVTGARETQVDLKSLIKVANETAGKLSQLPNTWAMAGWFVGVAITLSGLVFTIARAVK
ncbi:hypothetical protein [Reyranella massiliensis]|uniref:hypothetical protein n=1 Tax=Reyranella massiliensis TaxID=445220 RepID=UPI0002E50363|nr:hypothetical protein [Reyranella massiliensis]